MSFLTLEARNLNLKREQCCFLEALGKNMFLGFSSLGGCQHPLACGHIPLLHFHMALLCVSVFVSLYLSPSLYNYTYVLYMYISNW